MPSEINKPAQDTYFIIGDENKHYGLVTSDQVMKSGQDNLKLYYNKDDWVVELLKFKTEQELIDAGVLSEDE